MKRLFLLLLLWVLPVQAQESLESGPSLSSPDDVGIISLQSSHSVRVTSDRLEHLIRAQGLKIFARIDHQASAMTAKLALRPTILLIFADPKTETLLMHQDQAMGLDLPMKFLIWEAEDHAVFISWNNAYYLAQRHAISPHLDLLAKLSQT
ncbi:MAG TPA: DUF302 domain-containing protein, partial [Candidatus Obscuribacterales bacterium]